jgi:hypothetical protein
MRNLFLILVLVNLAFAAWYLWFSDPATDTRVVRDPNVPTIALASEAAPSGNSAVTPVVEPVVDEPAVMPAVRCVGIGPFSDIDGVEVARVILRTAGYESVQRSENGDVWLGHWIYLDNVTSQGQADALSDVLDQGGIGDTYFDPTGEEGDVLSLGVFREFNRAETIRIQALDLGFEPVMIERTRPGTVYWADLTLLAEETIDLEPLQAPGRIVRLEQRACDSR